MTFSLWRLLLCVLMGYLIGASAFGVVPKMTLFFQLYMFRTK